MKKMVNESLKEELIDTLMKTIYSDNDPEIQQHNREYLESLSVLELDEELGYCNLFNIKKVKK